MAEEGKVWYKSKTVWLQVVVVLIVALTLLSVLPLNEQTLSVIVLILAILGIALRFLTGKPITITAGGSSIIMGLDKTTDDLKLDVTVKTDETGENPPEPPPNP